MRLYLDNNATTMPAQECIDDFNKCVKIYDNPSSTYSTDGIRAHNMIEESRKKIAKYINAKPSEIYFTSGATESNNWAIKGWWLYALKKKLDMRFYSTSIEHSSVYKTLKFIESYGYKVDYFCVSSTGDARLYDYDIKDFGKNPFASVILANNEIGTIQNIYGIRALCDTIHALHGRVHVDATQAITHMPIDVKQLGCDTLSASGHKFKCFSGIGFLYIKEGTALPNLIHGGKQENGMRSGTENFNYIIPMANQIERLSENESGRWYNEKQNRNELYRRLSNVCEKNNIKVTLNGPGIDRPDRLNNNINVTLHGIDSSTLITLLDGRGIQISAGSACNSGNNEPSRVLKAIGLTDEEARQTIRISVDSSISIDQIDYFIKEVDECLKLLV